jgi:hypothetical protein
MAYSMVDSLVRAAIPAVVLSVFALARRYFPAKPAPKVGPGWSVEELSERFAVTQWLVGASMVLIGGAIAWGIHSILVSLNEFVAALDVPSDIVLFPQTAIWWFLPGFAAITLAWEITLGAWSRIGDRNEVMLYNYWTTAKAGFDSTRVLRIMVLVIVLPIAILTALEVPAHTSLGTGEIRARGYGFGGTQIYRYSEARKLTVIQGFRNRDGKLVKRAGVVLSFSDGRRWSSADIGDFKPNVDPKLVSLLQAKTGLSTEYAVAESDIR